MEEPRTQIIEDTGASRNLFEVGVLVVSQAGDVGGWARALNPVPLDPDRHFTATFLSPQA